MVETRRNKVGADQPAGRQTADEVAGGEQPEVHGAHPDSETVKGHGYRVPG
ncbi:hypothetical protein D3C73_1536240 [compost metagenome]